MCTIVNTNRLVWLDWMKVMAIFSIIWGHFFSEGYEYLYVFSVQTFCVISGFLYKQAENWQTCLRKAFWQLLIPTIIFSVVMHLEASLRCMAMGKSYDISWLWFFKWLLLGHRWCMGPSWYFYTLIVMRLIMQALPQKRWCFVLLFMALSAGAIVFKMQNIEISNANVNVLVCMPLFLIGVFLKPLRQRLNDMRNAALEMVLLLMAVFVIVLCGRYNGEVWMYLCGYGHSYILYIVGGVAGTVMLYVISLWLARLKGCSEVTTLSKGSIMIIGLHIIIVRRLTELPNRSCIEDFMFAALIFLAFVPLVRFAERYLPLLLGQKR